MSIIKTRQPQNGTVYFIVSNDTKAARALAAAEAEEYEKRRKRNRDNRAIRC